jgi:hypothetical protein
VATVRVPLDLTDVGTKAATAAFLAGMVNPDDDELLDVVVV